MTLAVVLDMDSRWWCESPSAHVMESLKFYISVLGNSVGTLGMSVYACFSDKTETVVSGDWSVCLNKIEDELESLIVRRKELSVETASFETPIAQGISKSILFLRKSSNVGVSPRVVVFECSRETVDFSSQSVALSNCGWSAGSSKVHVVSLASETPSSNLLSVCVKTGGVHIPHPLTIGGKLIQSMLFHLAAPDDGVVKLLKVRPQSSRTHMGTTCVCHNKPMDKGYVCSICLAIYCAETGAICSVCGSRFRREAKDELPVRLQVFSKLFSLPQ